MSSRRTDRHLSRAFAPGLLVGALVLAGCGGSSSDAAAPDSTASAPPGSAASPAPGTLAAAKAVAAPEALQFTATLVGGEPFDAATLAGKPVAMWFWAPG